MKKYKNIYIQKLSSVLFYLVTLLIILKTQSVFTYFSNIDLHINLLLVLVLMIFTFVRLLNKEIDIKKLKKLKIMIIVYYIFIFLYALVTKCDYRPFYVNYLIIFPSIVMNIVLSFDYQKTIKKILITFVNIIVFFASISLFFYLFGSLLKLIKPSNSVMINWGIDRNITSYYYLYYETQVINIFGNVICRNSSIFTEAPMYSLILSFALFYYIFLVDESKNKIAKIIVLIISLISTLTFSSFVCLFVIFIMYSFNKIKTINNKKIYFLCFFALIILSVTFFINRSHTISVKTRIDDFVAMFKTFIKYPFFGVGFNREYLIVENMSIFRLDNIGLSNTIGSLFANGGIYLSLFYLFPICYIIKSKSEKYMKYFCLFVFISLFLYIYLNTPLLLFNFAFMYAYIIIELENNKVELYKKENSNKKTRKKSKK